MFVHNSKLFMDIQHIYQTDRWKNSKTMLGLEAGIFRNNFHVKIHLNTVLYYCGKASVFICWKELLCFHQIIRIIEGRNLDTFSVKMTKAFMSNQLTWVHTEIQVLNSQNNLMKYIQFFDMHARVACENSPAFIPTSKKELNSALKVINDSMQDDLPRKLRNVSMKWVVSFRLKIEIRVPRTRTVVVTDTPLTSFLWRLWTDYERFNETHFWSDIASSWWSDNDESQINYYEDYFQFKSRGRFSVDFWWHQEIMISRHLKVKWKPSKVLFNGYKKLKNFRIVKNTSGRACCICIGKCTNDLDSWIVMSKLFCIHWSQSES